MRPRIMPSLRDFTDGKGHMRTDPAYPRRRGKRFGARRLLISALALTLAAAPAIAQRSAGEHIEIRGTVTDAQGRALPQVTVVFEAVREGLSLQSVRELRMDKGRTDERRAVTDPRGIYTLDWPWDPFFNRFEMRVELPVRGPDGERMEVLARRALPALRDAESPVIANLTVERAELISQLQDFLTHLDTASEREVYQRLGKPDRVERVVYEGSERVDASWWYFSVGKVFYFRSGELVEERNFQPVRPF